MAIYRGVSSVAREVKSIYRGVSAVARQVKAGYRGVSSVARQFYALALNVMSTYSSIDKWTVTSRGDVDTNNSVSSTYIKFGVCDYAGGVYSTLTAKSGSFDITPYKTLTVSMKRAGYAAPSFTVVSSNKTSANLASDLAEGGDYVTKTLDVSSYTGSAYIKITCTSVYVDGQPDGYQYSSCDIKINKIQFS